MTIKLEAEKGIFSFLVIQNQSHSPALQLLSDQVRKRVSWLFAINTAAMLLTHIIDTYTKIHTIQKGVYPKTLSDKHRSFTKTEAAKARRHRRVWYTCKARKARVVMSGGWGVVDMGTQFVVNSFSSLPRRATPTLSPVPITGRWVPRGGRVGSVHAVPCRR